MNYKCHQCGTTWEETLRCPNKACGANWPIPLEDTKGGLYEYDRDHLYDGGDKWILGMSDKEFICRANEY